MGSNFNPTDWSDAFQTNMHCIAAHSTDGMMYYKARPAPMVRRAITRHQPAMAPARLEAPLRAPDARPSPRAAAQAKTCPIVTGDKVQVELDMLAQSLTMTVVDKHKRTKSTVSVENLPPEVCVAVCFGAAPGEHAVRVVGSSSEKTGKDAAKTQKDLWDDDNPQDLVATAAKEKEEREKAAMKTL